MVIKTVRLTSKRQATLPLQLCEELGVKPGDEIYILAVMHLRRDPDYWRQRQ